MTPIGVSVFCALAYANLRLRRGSQKKIGQGVPGIGAAVRIDPARVVRKRGIKTEMVEIASELNGVRAVVDRDIIGKLVAAIYPGSKAGGIAHGGEGIAERNL